MVKSVAKGQLTRGSCLIKRGERNTTVVYGPQKKNERKGRVCVRSWCVVSSGQGWPWPEKGCPGRASHGSRQAPLGSCFVAPAEPRDSTEGVVSADAGAGRCPEAGAMQNMQEWG